MGRGRWENGWWGCWVGLRLEAEFKGCGCLSLRAWVGGSLAERMLFYQYGGWPLLGVYFPRASLVLGGFGAWEVLLWV